MLTTAQFFNPSQIPKPSNTNPALIFQSITNQQIQCQSANNRQIHWLIPRTINHSANLTPILCQSVSTQINQSKNILPYHTFTKMPIHDQSSPILLNQRQSVRTFQIFLKELVLYGSNSPQDGIIFEPLSGVATPSIHGQSSANPSPVWCHSCVNPLPFLF